MGVRKGLHAVWLFGLTASMMIFFLFLLPLPRWGMRGGLKAWARGAVWGARRIGGVTLEIRGQENLPKDSSYILAAKHQSLFDIVPPFIFSQDPLFVMKKELSKIPLFGWESRKAGMIEVDRGGQVKALIGMIADAKRLMAEPRQLVIFPEGTRSEPGEETSYKPGTAALYKELELPVVPVATNSGLHLDAQGLVRKSGTVVVQILPPIAPGLKRAEFMRLLQEQIDTASNALL